jgi:hypothetical protein
VTVSDTAALAAIGAAARELKLPTVRADAARLLRSPSRNGTPTWATSPSCCVPRPAACRRNRRPRHLQRLHPRNRHRVLPAAYQQDNLAAQAAGLALRSWRTDHPNPTRIRPLGRRLVKEHVLETAQPAIVSKQDDLPGGLLTNRHDLKLRRHQPGIQTCSPRSDCRLQINRRATAITAANDECRPRLFTQLCDTSEVGRQHEIEHQPLRRAERPRLIKPHPASVPQPNTRRPPGPAFMTTTGARSLDETHGGFRPHRDMCRKLFTANSSFSLSLDGSRSLPSTAGAREAITLKRFAGTRQVSMRTCWFLRRSGAQGQARASCAPG